MLNPDGDRVSSDSGSDGDRVSSDSGSDGDRVSSDSGSDKDREHFPRGRVLLIVCSFGLFILMAVLIGTACCVLHGPSMSFDTADQFCPEPTKTGLHRESDVL